MVTGKLEQEIGFSHSECATRFIIGITVSPFWAFPGRHFANCDRHGELGLVNGGMSIVTGLYVIWLISVARYMSKLEPEVEFRRQRALF